MKHILAVCILAFTSLLFAKTHKRAGVQSNKKIMISYGQKTWNKDSKKIESAYAIIKDNITKKYILLQLQETEPDSSIFRTIYKLKLSKNSKIIPSIYIPKQEDMLTSEGKKKALEKVREGKLPRKPYLFVKKNTSYQTLDVFDTKAQAKRALKAHRNNMALSDAQKYLQTEDLIDQSTIDSLKTSSLEKRLQEIQYAENERDKERNELQRIEIQRRHQLKRNFQNLSLDKKNKAKQEAKVLYDKGVTASQSLQHSEALDFLKQASDLDPTNEIYYYAYAISLFHNKQYNNSIVSFRVSKVGPNYDLEKNYYLGMNHYKLSEFQSATKIFKQVKSSKNKTLAGSSAFYLGLIQFQKEEFEISKENFEFVIDYSTDPNLDSQAESYIELILQAQKYKNFLNQPYTLNLAIGANYDSNILFTPDNSSTSSSATDDGGMRFLVNSSIDKKVIYTPKKELSYKAALTYMYSLDDEFAEADPLDMVFTVPYSKKSKAFEKNYKMSIDPGVELLYMDLEEDGTKDLILTSYFIKMNNTFIMNDRLVSSYNGQIYYNDSDIESTDSDSDATAVRLIFNYNHLYFLDKAKGTVLIGDIAATSNMAEGKNNKYNKVELYLNYIKPIPSWKSVLSTKVSTYHAMYSDDDSRKDTQLGLNVSLSRPLNDYLNLNGSFAYTTNTSNVDSKEYDRFVISTLLSGKWTF